MSRFERDRRVRRGMLFGGFGLLLLIAVVLVFGYWRENVARAQETVAVIFGEPITAGRLAEEVRPRLAAFNQRLALYRANGLEQQAVQLQLQRNTLPDSVLSELIEQRVVRLEAESRGVAVSQDEIDTRLRRQVAEVDAASQPQPSPTAAPASGPDATPTSVPSGAPTVGPTATPVPTLSEDRYPPALADLLNRVGLTEATLRQTLESELYEEKLREAMGTEIPAVQEQVRARHLVFRTEQEANEALQKLQSGTPFDELLGQVQQGGPTASQSGDLGWQPRLGRDPALDSALFELQPGQLSGVVRTLNGWEILQVLEREMARPVEESVLQELRRRHYGDWLAKAIAAPEIQRELSAEETAWVLQRAARAA
jgi:parvulin-like peptidyl-prolyl isomerase